jgi:hypothetical protein
VRGDGDRQQRHRDALARGQQHVQLATRRVSGDLTGLVEELVGRVAHGGHDDDHVVAVLLRLDDALGHALDALGVRDGGTAVLLYHQGHGSRLPAATSASAQAAARGCTSAGGGDWITR